MSGSRLRPALVIAALAAGALVLLAFTQTWFALTLVGGLSLEVPGQDAAPALSAFAFAALAVSAALTIAGPVLRIALGAVEVLIGALVVVVAAVAVADPIAASASTITAATAVSGPESVASLVLVATVSAFGILAIVAGALLSLIGLAVVVTARRWPGPSRRYQADGAGATSAGDWDALSGGSDPTAR